MFLNLILFSSYTHTWEQDYLVQSSCIRFGSYMTLCLITQLRAIMQCGLHQGALIVYRIKSHY